MSVAPGQGSDRLRRQRQGREAHNVEQRRGGIERPGGLTERSDCLEPAGKVERPGDVRRRDQEVEPEAQGDQRRDCHADGEQPEQHVERRPAAGTRAVRSIGAGRAWSVIGGLLRRSGWVDKTGPGGRPGPPG